MAHKVFVAFLIFIVITAVVALGAHGLNYYLTPLHERTFRSDYEVMKPSASYGLGLGIVGALLITVGVSTYSSRKRVRALWNLGKLSRWLEFHIFLCLLGPVLVVYHTTFKTGGIAGLSLWTMLAVVASGLIGRFLYVQIPRNKRGNELSAAQISSELQQLSERIASSPLGSQIIRRMEESFAALPKPESLSETVRVLLHLHGIRKQVRTSVLAFISGRTQSRHVARELYRVAATRALLQQKSLMLTQVEKLFHYWHAVHLPFSIIMFITLAAHVTATILFGYSWIF